MTDHAPIFKFKPHPAFRLNGESLDRKKIDDYAKRCDLNGEPFEQEIGKFLKDFINPKLTLEVFTSGSTGPPKTIHLQKEKMINSAKATGKFFDLPESTTALLCLPTTYIAGKMMLVRAMVLGWHLTSVVPTSNPLDRVYKRFDFCALTPFQLDNSINRLHLIKKLIVGGGKVSAHLQKRLTDVETKIYETYGMTETITHIAARPINNTEEEPSKIPFKALKKVKLTVDERNCLVINAPKIADAPIKTNDIVELISAKKFFWKGRFDRVINSGGIKIFPEQVERKLEPYIKRRFFIYGLSDDSLGDRVVLFIEGDFSEEAMTEIEKIIESVESLGPYEKPKKIYFIEKFEETHTGKIHRINTSQAKRH